MIAYIKGKMAYKSRTKIIIETYGIGYEVEISLNTYNKIQAADEVQLLIAQIIREDAHTLYGFAEGDEKNMFEHLISVAGVGPNTARILLSALQPAEIRAAIIAEKETILRNAKGIGPKNAKRIILELKDKLLKDSGAESEQIAATLVSENPVREEALSALVALGFNKIQVQKTLNAVLKDNPQVRDSGDLIKMALGALT